MVQVVAEPVQTPVLAGAALDVREHRRAHLSDQCAGCVNEGQAFLDLFVCKAVPKKSVSNQLQYNKIIQKKNKQNNTY